MLDFEEVQALKEKQLKLNILTVSKISDDEFLYRGKTIRRQDNVPNGYGGRYTVKARHQGGKVYNLHFTKRSEATSYIDSLIEKANMTPSEKCKAAGLNSLAEVSRMTKAPQCTLYVWAKNKPELFKAVVAGCAVIKHEESK